MKYSITLLQGMCALALWLLSTTVLSSQCATGCDIQCINQLNLSLNETCQAEFTPDMGAIGVTFGDACYTVTVSDAHGRPIPGNILTIDYLDENLTYEVKELECGNKCWGNVKVEYKLAPQIDCPEDMTIACNALDYLDLPPATGGCAAFNVQLYNQEKVHLDCDPDYQAYVDRTYVATDTYGNASTCTHRIYLERVQLDDILFPGPASISCSDTTMRYNADGLPFPWYFEALTGSGTAMGIPLLCNVGFPTGFSCSGLTGSGSSALPLIPGGGAVIIKETPSPDHPYEVEFIPDSNAGLLCNAVLLYSDLEFPVASSCKRKIVRTWEVFEWWCHEELMVGGQQIIEIIDDRPPVFDCPAPQLVSTSGDCAGTIALPPVDAVDECGEIVNVRINYDGGVVNENGGIATLKTGPNVITYTVSDNCHNSSSCTTVFTVKDQTAPVAICERDKVVSLTTTATTRVPAEVFDNGSFDDCHLDKFEVRRMENTCTEVDTAWSHYVDFCCVDAQFPSVMVAMRVTDAYGNASQCMIAVEVQDKSVPTISCPDDMTINCTEAYDMNNLGHTFGNPEVTGNCAVTQIPKTDIDENMSQCGTGSMVRTFSILDGSGNVLRSCKQEVTVTNDSPFTYEQVIWPLDYEVSNICDVTGLHPDFLPHLHNYPTFEVQEGQCSLLGYDYTDKVFSADPLTGECAVIQRTWTVVDWCSTSVGNVPVWRSPVPQLIKIVNDVAPQLAEPVDQSYETLNGDCNSGEISITRFAIDDCSNGMSWKYIIKESPSGDIIETGDTNEITGKYPTGTYTIEWTVYDGCGNLDSDIQNLHIFSTKAPTPICHSGLSASLVSMDLDGDGVIDAEMVELWASDFDAGSYPACDNPIILSFSADTSDRVMFFDCDDLGRQNVQMWVTDVVTGNQDFCIAFIDIQDVGICPDSELVVVEGQVRTEKEVEVVGVEMALRGTPDMQLTDNTGNYAFGNMPLGGSYVVAPSHDINYLNGVSTIDLIKIQRHILGIEMLDSPYKLIAADINNSGTINGIDLVELRKLILGIYTELPNNDSWRFISTEYNFLDPLNPWAESWMEAYEINGLASDMTIDFIGVKIGDVNDSVEAASSNTIASRNNAGELTMNMQHASIAEGDIASVVFSSDNYIDIAGWQGTLEFDADKMDVIAVNNLGIEGESSSHFHIADGSAGWMTMSYNALDNILGKGSSLFEIVIQAKTDITQDEDLFMLSSSVTPAEAYSVSFEKKGLLLSNYNPAELSEIVSVLPNPWINNADIKIRMAQSDNCLLEFFNVNGQLIHKATERFAAGINKYAITKEQLNTEGFVYVRMTVRGVSSDYRMMIY